MRQAPAFATGLLNAPAKVWMRRGAASSAYRFLGSLTAFLLVVVATPLPASENDVKTPIVGYATRHGRSAPLRNFTMIGPGAPRPNREVRNEVAPKRHPARLHAASDPVVQKGFGRSQPEAVLQFEGGSDTDNAAVNRTLVVPPDTEGDVGPDHYIQYINNVYTIYDKSGNALFGPFAGNAFWSGFGGPCEVRNDGDPVVKYDRQADRWVFTQFALPSSSGPFYQCFAISETNDPMGAYNLYEFKTSDDFFSDYPKLGVWPDAYYMTFNMFGPGEAFRGGAYAFDRGAMLAGAPVPAVVIFDTGQEGGVLPSDLDGPMPPPAGAPNYFMTFEVEPARLIEWQFHVDWTTPANSTFLGPIDIPVADFLSPVCGAARGQCIPQLGTSALLETLDQDLMYRLAYRNFGDHQSIVANHTVGTENGSAAVRWYEVRSPGDTPTLYQQGTYAPDASSRWMGSIAMDRSGNIALGYSKSSAAIHPSIGITGRLAGDPIGTMGAEDVWFAGGGSQSGQSRWGDYSTMSIDPTDDCTFWYTQEYYASTGNFDFKTRIGAFRFPSCTSGPTGKLEGTVTSGSSRVNGATVTATPSGSAATGGGASTTTTDASGHYQFLTLPVGTYDMTVSKFPYLPASAAGVGVSGGGDTVRNFELDPSTSVLVSGTVKDGSGQGWPLYAKLVVSGPSGFATTTLFADPVTGSYSIALPAGFAYGFVVTAVAPGYVPGGGPLSPAGPGGEVADWSLAAAPSCTAPGYGPGGFVGPLRLSEGFDAGAIPAGWTVDTVSGNSWDVYAGGDPCLQFDGNRTGGSGPYAIFNSRCFGGFTTDSSSLVTPPIDLSGRASAAIRWANDFIDFNFGSVADVDVSTDGAATWTNVWRAPGDVPGPGTQAADMSFAAGRSNVRARFHFKGFEAWWWQVDNVEVGTFDCSRLSGGLVVGTVRDANTSVGLNGATVKNLSGGTPATTFPTPEDPAQGDGFYILFSQSGSQSFDASFPAHDPQSRSGTVISNGTVRLDFSLTAGRLDVGPRPLSMLSGPGGARKALTLTLKNTGTGTGDFVIHEVAVPPTPTAAKPVTFAATAEGSAALRRVPFDRMNFSGTKGLPRLSGAPESAPKLMKAGNVVSSFSTGLSAGWGLAYDTDVNRLWISNSDAASYGHPGDGFAYQYLPDGTRANGTIDIRDTGGLWQAEGTYNGRTRTLWQVNVGGDGCLFEMDPVARAVTGKKICGPWPSSQRAAAYDYATDTYYVGGTNEATVYHVDGSGNLLDFAYIGLGISGLAYNPSTQHLFVASEFPAPFNVWVVEPRNAYAVRGGFVAASGGVPALPNGNASLEADCDGRLWTIDPATQTVYVLESGEAGWCVDDIPWLSESPEAGAVPGGTQLSVAVTFNPAGLLPGLRQGSLVFTTDTPTPVDPVPVDLTVLFGDVPPGRFPWNYIYGAAGAGVMPGCSPQGPSFSFCPGRVVTRRSMAGLIERAVHGALTPPPVYLNGFSDVAPGSEGANYIQGLWDDGITSGCGVNPPRFCPDAAVTRAQAAVLMWRAQHGSQPPPPCTPPGIFADVPCPGGFTADYIEGIYAEGITTGCGNGNYCPNAGLTNAQMAVFLVRAFSIPYMP